MRRTSLCSCSRDGPTLPQILLVLDGVKMGARVLVNGIPLGNVSNQFVRYVFPLPPGTKPTGNTLEIAFDSSIALHGERKKEKKKEKKRKKKQKQRKEKD
jgi:hypothetical protein